MRLKALVLTLIIITSSCGIEPRMGRIPQNKFPTRMPKRSWIRKTRPMHAPSRTEIEDKIKLGASKSCLLFAANDIAIAVEPDQREQARQQFDSC
ncbi:MAG: hypothetical protein ACJZ6C_05900 [Candidatus Poriferisodalaceae bacterium]